jgi:hypothetical protein
MVGEKTKTNQPEFIYFLETILLEWQVKGHIDN